MCNEVTKDVTKQHKYCGVTYVCRTQFSSGKIKKYCNKLTSLKAVVSEQSVIRIAICHKPQSRILQSRAIILDRNISTFMFEQG